MNEKPKMEAHEISLVITSSNPNRKKVRIQLTCIAADGGTNTEVEVSEKNQMIAWQEMMQMQKVL